MWLGERTFLGEKVGSRKWWGLRRREDVSQGKGGLEKMMGPKEKMFFEEKICPRGSIMAGEKVGLWK
jgi:hypothetical protein